MLRHYAGSFIRFNVVSIGLLGGVVLRGKSGSFAVSCQIEGHCTASDTKFVLHTISKHII